MKKKIKNFIIFILIIIVLVLGIYMGYVFLTKPKSSSTKQLNQVDTKDTNLVEKNNIEFSKINEELQKQTIISIDIKGDILLLLETKIPENEGEQNQYNLKLWNLLKNQEIAKIDLKETKLNDIFGANFTNENEIMVYDENEEKAEIYDLNLQWVRNTTYKRNIKIDQMVEKVENKEFKNIDSSFTLRDNFAQKNAEKYQAIVFYENENNAYVQKNLEDYNVAYSFGKKIIYTKENNNKIKICVRDYNTYKEINNMEIDIETLKERTNLIYPSIANDKYICIPINNEEGYLDSIYFCDYETNKKEDIFEVKRLKNEEIEEQNKNIVEDIKEKYDLDVHINERKDDIWNYKTEIEPMPLKIFISLNDIEYMLSLFPKNIFKEMYEEDCYGFDIYLVKCILEENIDAFSSDKDGRIFIVYGTNTLNKDTIVHEIMHTAEYRIIKYEPGIDEKWKKLNPKNFVYDSEMTSTYSDEMIKKYFKREYGTKSILEDRAVTFEGMFEFGMGEGQNEDWLKSRVILKKAELIANAFRRNFPSVQKSQKVIWEKCLDNITNN